MPINEPRTFYLNNHRDQSDFNRCRFGHWPPNRGNKLFDDVGQRFYEVPSLQELFEIVKADAILYFLKTAAAFSFFTNNL